MKLYSFIFFFLSIFCYSQNSTVDINSLLNETQLESNLPDDLGFFWWIPVEFWEASFEQDKSISEEETKEIIDVLKPYTIFAIVDGKIGPFGGVTYVSIDSVVNNIFLIDKKANRYPPLDIESLDPNLQNLLSSIKPMLKNMLGEMGENMHFFVFKDYDKKKNRITNPISNEQFILNYRGNDYTWKTPLGSLMPPKICPKDNEKMNGAWNYCPWHGEKLEPLKN